MKISTRPAFSNNSTIFTFEGYLSKLVRDKKNGKEDRILGAYVSFGSNKYGKIWVSFRDLKSNVNHLEEGKPYTFTATVGTRFNTELEYIRVVSAHPIEEEREPIKNMTTRLVGTVVEIYPTLDQNLDVVKFECESENRSGKEYYMCRLFNCSENLLLDKWTVDIELRQSNKRLFGQDEEETIFDGEIESEEIWVKEKDVNGNVMTYIDEKGNIKENVKKVRKDVFYAVMSLSPIAPLE